MGRRNLSSDVISGCLYHASSWTAGNGDSFEDAHEQTACRLSGASSPLGSRKSGVPSRRNYGRPWSTTTGIRPRLRRGSGFCRSRLAKWLHKRYPSLKREQARRRYGIFIKASRGPREILGPGRGCLSSWLKPPGSQQ